MIQCIILVLCVQSSAENLLDEPPVIQRQGYTKQIVVNSIFSIGLGLGAGYFHKRGNDVYDEYLNSTGDNFEPPPPIKWAWFSGAWYDYHGNLAGVRLEVEFFEACTHPLTITHALYGDTSMTALTDTACNAVGGQLAYYVDLIHGLTVGTYNVRISFAELYRYTAWFQVGDDAGKMVVIAYDESGIVSPVEHKLNRPPDN